MDKLARLFVRRLEQLARREARRMALRGGLLDCKVVEVGGHMLRRYSPAFDTGSLTGDPVRDGAWFRRNFGSWLVEAQRTAKSAPGDGENIVVTVEPTDSQPAAPFVAFPRKRRDLAADGASIGNAGDRRSHAVRLVGAAAPPPLVSHVVAALVLARAIRDTEVPLGDIVRTVVHVTPVVTLHAPLDGFEREVQQLLGKSAFVPGGPFAIVDVDHMFNDDHYEIAPGEEARRRIVTFVGDSVHRVTGKHLRRRMISAFSRGFPILAIAEKRSDIPALVHISADVSLETGRLDRAFIGDLAEALYPDTAIGGVDLPHDRDARWLSLEDLILAFRPGRDLADVLSVLALLIERNREDAGDEDDEEHANRPTSRKIVSQSPSQKDKGDGGSDGGKPSASNDTNPGGWKRDKPSGAEVIQPDPQSDGSSGGGEGTKPPLIVESLSGYGRAKDWALDLKADLDDYRASALAWSQMSTRLLLSGPPGTGKTTFARALCNSLAIPLVVTSVSTWLQGEHLNDVINRMAKTFAEAKALAPCILFIDEIDGIGKRQPAEREYADYWNAVVNKALELLDGAVKSEGVIIVGATNRPDDIDEAIKRSGRLERHIEIPKPDVPTLAEILAHHLGDDVRSLIREADPDPLREGMHGAEQGSGEAATGKEGANR